MEYESFINQWTVNSYEAGHLGATIMPMAEEAGFPYDDHYLHYHQQLPAIKATTTTVDDFHNRPEKHLKANDSYESCIIPRPEPCNNFSASGSSTVAAASIFYPANPTGMAVIKPKQDINDYDGLHVAPKFTLDGLHYPFWNNNDQITYDMESGTGGEKRKVISVMSAATTRSSAAQDHVIAERKRREKLSQRFIALSAVVPGLKKTDKASVLADAIKYIKQLEERVKILDDQTKSKTVESVVLMKRSPLVIIDGKNKPSIEGGLDDDQEQLQVIEARVCNKDVLIRVHCDNKKGVIEKILGEMSKLHFMSVVNTNVLAFGSSAFDVTIVAQMDAECCMTVKEIAKTLRAAFVGLM